MGAPTFIPLAGAVAVLGDRPAVGRALTGAAVQIGNRPEIRVDALPRPLSARIDRWWDGLANAPPVRYVTTTMVLRDARQMYTKTRRADLSDDYDVMRTWPELADIIDDLLGADRAAGQAAAASAGAAVADITGGWTWTLAHHRPSGWPDLYGGVRWPRETLRTLTVVVRDAKWRDRRLRRLSEVRVDSVSEWPLPARMGAGRRSPANGQRP